MDSNDVQADLKHVLYTKEQIQQRITELAAEIDKDYEGRELLIVGVLKGAVMVTWPAHCTATSPWTGWPCPPMAPVRSPPAWCAS